MHQQFFNIGAVRLIGWRIQSELHGADNPAAERCSHQYRVARFDRACDFAKERQGLILRERRHEADAGAALDGIDQDISQLRERAVRERRTETSEVGLVARLVTHAARSSFEATVASALSR